MRRSFVFIFLSALVLVACSPGSSPVVSMSPGDGLTNVTLGASITAILRDPIGSTGPEDLIVLYRSDGVPVAGTVSYDPTTRSVTFDPTNELEPGTTYTVVVMPLVKPTFSSMTASSRGQEQRWSFTTAPGMVITATSPADGAVDVSLDSLIEMQFQNSVDEEQLRQRFTLATASGAIAPGVLSYDPDAKLATFTPDARLRPGTSYTAAIRPKDAGNKQNSAESSWSFTTAQDRLNLVTHQAAALVLGRKNEAYGYYPGGLGDTSFSGPLRGNPTSWNGALYLPDRGNNRLLVHHAMPRVDEEAADAVIGQSRFDAGAAGNGPGQFDATASATIANGKLLVADRNNNRVLVWDGAPLYHEDAALVIGQFSFGTSTAACAPDRLNAPASVFAVDGRLIVADSGNNRVLIWNELPSQAGQPADLVLGQQSLSECGANRASSYPDAGTLSQPGDAWSDGQLLVVADTGNNRLLVWEAFPTSSGEPASFVVGQGDFSSSYPATGADRLSGPGYLTSNGSQLFVADTYNNRVLVWEEIPRQNGVRADVVLGQGDFECNIENSYYYEESGWCDYMDPNWEIRTTHQNMYAPAGLHVLDGVLLVADGGNNRYMIFESQP